MKKKPGINMRNICGENIIVAEGNVNIDFTNILSLNESAAYLWQRIGDEHFDIDTLTQWLMEEYEVDIDTARQDVIAMVDKWLELNIIE
ncbi:MAG: PqqD family protein [Prevotella sp.]|nr:PqqD family protein [Prevotella sp.]MDD6818054.1 PqqD family protein [Prevotellaceae bacterium]MCI6558298.1 PqqD family protein [Prevotella sp.]MCI7046467.1 PqqD family protein [Prevotella sp.]MDD6843325.1 PqqD family protein [Prevotellaceae bacterium]